MHVIFDSLFGYSHKTHSYCRLYTWETTHNVLCADTSRESISSSGQEILTETVTNLNLRKKHGRASLQAVSL